MTSAVADDFITPEVLSDPVPYFTRLREDDPVHWSAWLNSWVVSRHDDVWQLLRQHDDLLANTVAPVRDALPAAQLAARHLTFEMLSEWLPFNDPPQHTRLRKAINRSFTPRRVEEMRPRVEAIAERILDELEREDGFEVVEGYSRRLTVEVIAGLLGLPDDDLPTILPAVHQIQALVHSALASGDRRVMAETGFAVLVPYFLDLVAERRAHPSVDLISAMSAMDDSGPTLSDEQIAATGILLIFAGQETTTSLVASSVLALLQHPDQLASVRDDPTLVPQAVEEALRYWGVAWSVTRIAARDFEVHGRQLHAGDRLFLALGAANRDPRKYEKPDDFDIMRMSGQHLAFGSSIHFCLGAPLARLEDEVALRALLRRFPDIRLDPAHTIRWVPQLITRQIEFLHVLAS